MPEAWYDQPGLKARLPVLIYGLRRIHACPHADRRTKLRWYFWEPIGWARYTWEIRRRYPLTRAYRRILKALGVREVVPGDSMVRYVLTEPWEYPPSYWWGRLQCTRYGRHNRTCRGRGCPPEVKRAD